MKIIHILYLIDRSGSVTGTLGPHAGKCEMKNFIIAQRKLSAATGDTILLTLVTFDGIWTECFKNQNVNTIQYEDADWDGWTTPRGSTALIDTILDSCPKWERTVQTEKLRHPPSTKHEQIIIVWTDGGDNASSNNIVAQNIYIRQMRQKGVTCLWTASCQDAVKTGMAGGFAANHCLNVPTQVQRAEYRGAPAMFRSATVAVRSVSDGHGVNFTQQNTQFSQALQGQTAPVQSSRGQTAPIQPGTGQTAPVQLGHGQTAPVQLGHGQTAPIQPGTGQTSANTFKPVSTRGRSDGSSFNCGRVAPNNVVVNQTGPNAVNLPMPPPDWTVVSPAPPMATNVLPFNSLSAAQPPLPPFPPLQQKMHQ
jgi:hypothetical protein